MSKDLESKVRGDVILFQVAAELEEHHALQVAREQFVLIHLLNDLRSTESAHALFCVHNAIVPWHRRACEPCLRSAPNK